MARKIRFPLKMKNGAAVRDFEELKDNFDLESVIGYFTDGRLTAWLADRYYDEKAKAIGALSADMPDFKDRICEILEVEYKEAENNTDIELIARRREKLQILSSIIDDKDILDNIDLVAMSQDELFDILDKNPEKVYLYGEKFSIPSGKKGICYIGVNNPVIILENDKSFAYYAENCIEFKNVQYEDNVNPYVTLGEKLFLEGRYQEAFPLIEQSANNGNPRAMYIMACYYAYGYETVIIDLEKRNKWCERAYSYNETISMYGYAGWCLEKEPEKKKEIYEKIVDNIKNLAEKGDIFAAQSLGYMYNNGYGIEQDKTKAVEWYRRSAKQGNASGQCNLGNMYENGQGVTQDYAEAVKWYRKAAEQGHASAQNHLGTMYESGNGVDKDYAKAFEWYGKAADQGYDIAMNALGIMYEEGHGVPRDTKKAREWYKKAADLGNKYAKNNLWNLNHPQPTRKSIWDIFG